MALIEDPPVRSKVLGEDGKMSRPWRLWFEALTNTLNNTTTLDVVTQASPEILTGITYINGE